MRSEAVPRRYNRLMETCQYEAFGDEDCNAYLDYLFLISVEIVLFSI